MCRTKKFSIIGSIVILILLGCSVMHEASREERKEMQERRMGGVVFLATQKLEDLKRFYMDKVGCRLWLDQGDCLIFQHGNFLFGFCRSKKAERDGILTFFYTEKEDVDRMYKAFEAVAASRPRLNEKFRIYHFFAKDPEGRSIEFQYFDHEIPAF